MRCPCCGAEWDIIPVDRLPKFMSRGTVVERVVVILAEIYPGSITRTEIAARIYGSNFPKSEFATVSKMVGDARKMLERLGWTIPRQTSSGPVPGHYRLVRLDEVKEAAE